MADKDPFTLLEDRIDRAVAHLKKLRAERDMLQAKQVELESQLGSLDKRNRELEAEAEILRGANADQAGFEGQRKEIERRIEGLLDRFSELDTMVSE